MLIIMKRRSMTQYNIVDKVRHLPKIIMASLTV